jgi:hypothetical protein
LKDKRSSGYDFEFKPIPHIAHPSIPLVWRQPKALASGIVASASHMPVLPLVSSATRQF